MNIQNNIIFLQSRIEEIQLEIEKLKNKQRNTPTYKMVVTNENGNFINKDGEIIFTWRNDPDSKYFNDYNVPIYRYQYHCEGVEAERKLTWLRDFYRGGWKPQPHIENWIVILNEDEKDNPKPIVLKNISNQVFLFSFPTLDMARRFSNEQYHLLNEWGKKFK